MRHIQLDTLLAQLFADEAGKKIMARLAKAHTSAAKKRTQKTRTKYIRANGSGKWKPVKDWLTAQLGDKCWYTEVELVGAPLVIDHYRPVCAYWWLAFDSDNYRVSCPWANSPEHNALHGWPGGKGECFPLLHPAVRATRKEDLPNERPVILDPCNAQDCELLAFQLDGRPVLHPNHACNADASYRVEQSKILLNLDHPAFNSKREQLCRDIAKDVSTYEELPEHSPNRITIRASIEGRLAPKAPFSTAARFYLSLHRNLDWVEEILNQP
jgi:hypothetical protein